MGVGCCYVPRRKLADANNQQELKQFVDEEIKFIKERKLGNHRQLDTNQLRIKNELIHNCEELSNNLGRIKLNFFPFDDCKFDINEFFDYVECEDLDKVCQLKAKINENYFAE